MNVLFQGKPGRAQTRWVLHVMVGWCVFMSRFEAQAQLSREYDVKAVCLFNFAQFVEWPAEAFPDAQVPLTIGILGSDPFNRVLDDVVKDERVRNRPVMVQRYERVEEVGLCHILFISNSESRRLPQILRALQGRPILTVSELDDFVRQGGMVRLYTDKAKIRLRINNDTARAAGLVISSKLLRLATVVTTGAQE